MIYFKIKYCILMCYTFNQERPKFLMHWYLVANIFAHKFGFNNIADINEVICTSSRKILKSKILNALFSNWSFIVFNTTYFKYLRGKMSLIDFIFLSRNNLFFHSEQWPTTHVNSDRLAWAQIMSIKPSRPDVCKNFTLLGLKFIKN